MSLENFSYNLIKSSGDTCNVLEYTEAVVAGTSRLSKTKTQKYSQQHKVLQNPLSNHPQAAEVEAEVAQKVIPHPQQTPTSKF